MLPAAVPFFYRVKVVHTYGVERAWSEGVYIENSNTVYSMQASSAPITFHNRGVDDFS
jgi:hypothetical protein